MLLLVLAHGHVRGAVGQDVGGHQHGVVVEPDGGVLAVLAGLLLELGHAAEPAQPRHAVEDPGELGVLANLALVEQDARLGIDARGDVGGRHRADLAGKLGRAAPHRYRLRDGVHVDHAEDALVRLLHGDPLHHGAQVVAKVQVAGRLHAGEDARCECHGDPSGRRALWRGRGRSATLWPDSQRLRSRSRAASETPGAGESPRCRTPKSPRCRQEAPRLPVPLGQPHARRRRGRRTRR